jgi:anti-sigma regulatory factor (Ser/Thr protein kinase)
MEDISLHILDIAENSISAGASLVKITISGDRAKGLFSVAVEDNGEGIPEDIRAKVLDPFCTTRTMRKVGLGLPLLAQSARETGGDITVETVNTSGTIVTATFRQSHIDMKPLGDISETLIVLIAGNPHVDFLFIYKKDGNTFSLDTRQIKEELDGVPITSSLVLSFLREYLSASLRDINKQAK